MLGGTARTGQKAVCMARRGRQAVPLQVVGVGLALPPITDSSRLIFAERKAVAPLRFAAALQGASRSFTHSGIPSLTGTRAQNDSSEAFLPSLSIHCRRGSLLRTLEKINAALWNSHPEHCFSMWSRVNGASLWPQPC